MQKPPQPFHRYLIRMDTRALGHLYTDCLVIGAGVAGMRAALAAAQVGKVTLLVKDDLTQSNTYRAQGGIAAVVDQADSLDSHIADTLTAGAGLCDENVVREVVSRGPDQIRQLLDWAMPFDRDGDKLQTGREGGHSHNRILHSHGDATGLALAETLAAQILGNPNIRVFTHCFAIDLITLDGACFGVVCYHPKYRLQCIWARRTVLAAGGAGRLYRETTNPACATADGLAMAWRAGVILTDMEFMQFHPTTLYVAGATRALITEAIRGEGGYLVDRQGNRFMEDYHALADLAPRDIVSRAIYRQMDKTESGYVYLDVRHLGKRFFAERFPHIDHLCRDFDIDPDTDLIPVRPSAHYMIGGVQTDLNGRTSVAHLYCCGEASATGLHGANRLASNSLLEGMVFGQICGQNVAHDVATAEKPMPFHVIVSEIEESMRTPLDVADVTDSLRAAMIRRVGVSRDGRHLEETLGNIHFWQRYVMDKVFDDPQGWQCQNMLTIAGLVVQSALARTESRGTHYRTDYPEPNEAQQKIHIECQIGSQYTAT